MTNNYILHSAMCQTMTQTALIALSFQHDVGVTVDDISVSVYVNDRAGLPESLFWSYCR